MSNYVITHGKAKHYVASLNEMATMAIEVYNDYLRDGAEVRYARIERGGEEPLTDFEYERLLRCVARKRTT